MMIRSLGLIMIIGDIEEGLVSGSSNLRHQLRRCRRDTTTHYIVVGVVMVIIIVIIVITIIIITIIIIP